MTTSNFQSYDEVVQHFAAGMPSIQLPPQYSYHEENLESVFAYQSGHSTNSERPNIVCILPSNFPLFSSVHSTTTAQKSNKVASTSFQSYSKSIDHASHVLEMLLWSSNDKSNARDGLHHVWLFGDWTEAGPVLSMVLGSECRVRSFTTLDIDKPITQELDWILFLSTLRSQIPVTDRIYLFFDWPHSASNESERHQFMMLQLVTLFILKADQAMMRIILASEQNRDLKYPKGRLVIPMSDNPVIEQLLLWTSNAEYSTEFERYPAARLRDQFTFFVRETFEQVKYQDSMNGAVISYLVKRQQNIQAQKSIITASMKSSEELDMLSIPMIELREFEFATKEGEGYIAIQEKRSRGGEEDGEEEEEGAQDVGLSDRVFMYKL